MNNIIAEINIEDENINKNIRIINLYEAYELDTNTFSSIKLVDEHKNEDEIKYWEISINNKSIKFNYPIIIFNWISYYFLKDLN